MNQLIAGYEERLPQARDEYGNWEASDSPRKQSGALHVPVVEATAIDLPQLTWPDGKSFALCLSHDVDLVERYSTRQRMRHLQRMWVNGQRNPADVGRAISTAVGKWFVSQAKRNQRDPYSQFEQWLEVEEKLGFRSTFFFFSDAGSRWHKLDEEYALDDRICFQGRRC